MISFSKTLNKKYDRAGLIDTDEMFYGSTISGGEQGYAEKAAIGNLSFTQMERMYIVNVWVRSIVDKIVNRVSNISPIIKPIKSNIGDNRFNRNEIKDDTKKNIETINEFLNKPNDNNESMFDIRRKFTRDLLKFDAGAFEIVTGITSEKESPIVELYNVSGDTIKLNVDNKGSLKNRSYIQILNSSLEYTTSWNKDEMVYGMLNPQSNRVYGLSPLESLNQTVTAELYASNYNSDFFYNNATPRYAVMMEDMGIGQGGAAMQRFRQWWERELKGKPHKPIILGTEQGKIKFEKVGLSNDEMQFQEYSMWLLFKMMAVYHMQPAVLGIADAKLGKADAKGQLNQFKIDAVNPQLMLFKSKFNQQVIFSKSVFGFKDVYLDFDIDFGDRKEQAEIDEIYARMGAFTINDIRVRGLGLTPVEWGDVPYMQNNISPFGIGPNGQSLPNNASAQSVPSPQEVNIPNLQSSARKTIEDYVMNDEDGLPIGWEHKLEFGERIEVLKKVLKYKENLMRTYFYNKDGGS